jgi:hypothetical protein
MVGVWLTLMSPCRTLAQVASMGKMRLGEKVREVPLFWIWIKYQRVD